MGREEEEKKKGGGGGGGGVKSCIWDGERYNRDGELGDEKRLGK